MKPYITSFLLFVLVGCNSNSLILSPTQYTLQGKEHTKVVNNNHPKLPSMVHLKEVKKSFWGRKAVLEIQGWYSSQGLQARRLNKIDWIKEIEGDQLTLTFYVQPKKGIGKGNAYTYGYNYQQELTLKLPSSIKQLNFKLIEQNSAQQDTLSYQSHEFLSKLYY